jgi:hypothetical protein
MAHLPSATSCAWLARSTVATSLKSWRARCGASLFVESSGGRLRIAWSHPLAAVAALALVMLVPLLTLLPIADWIARVVSTRRERIALQRGV